MAADKDKKDFWVTEWYTPHSAHRHHIKTLLVQKQTRFQRAQVADTHAFGRCLILDGEMQSAQLDEFIYHESLVHPPLVAHPRPRSVLIMGGGEGATAREVLKHRSVERCVMVDIDGEVIDFCKRYMEPWHKGCFRHPKVELVVGDAKKYVEETSDRFDVILSDLPTPIEAGPACMLYTIEFYRDLAKKLAPGGVFCLQAGSGNLIQLEVHAVLHRTLSKVFPSVRPYYAYVPSFDVPWAYLLCSQAKADPLKLSAAAVESVLARRVHGPLRFYDGVTHEGLFRVPKYLRAALAAEKRVMTAARPIYFYK